MEWLHCTHTVHPYCILAHKCLCACLLCLLLILNKCSIYIYILEIQMKCTYSWTHITVKCWFSCVDAGTLRLITLKCCLYLINNFSHAQSLDIEMASGNMCGQWCSHPSSFFFYLCHPYLFIHSCLLWQHMTLSTINETSNGCHNEKMDVAMAEERI